MMKACQKHKKNPEKEFCERKLKGSLEYQCFDLLGAKKKELTSCLDQKSLS